MIISIFSKFDMAGGSEFRCLELANGIADHTDHQAFLLAEKKMPDKLKEYISPKVSVVENCFASPSYFYNSNYIIVINTDSVEFSTLDYWMGKSSRHNFSIDMHRLRGKTMCFLYNFLISPSRHLKRFTEIGIKVKVVSTNTKFFHEITKQDRYEDIRILPRYILESPINPEKLDIFIREPKEEICFGMHSKRSGNKWNDEFYKLIQEINKRYIDSGSQNENPKIEFRFMGIKEDLRKKMIEFSNVVAMKEDEETVRDFLKQIDVFLFFPDWKREEPWARVIAEAIVSGCPVIALDKGGTSDQVLNYNNGILCKNYKDYFKSVVYFIEHKGAISEMSKNSIAIGRSFYSKSIIEKLVRILEI